MTIDQIKQMIEEEHYKLQKELYEESCSDMHIKKEVSSGSGGSSSGFSGPVLPAKPKKKKKINKEALAEKIMAALLNKENQ